MRVLIVDDDELIVEGLTALLETEAIPAAGALDRATAAQLIGSEFFPVVLADLRLHTEEEGLRLLEEIRCISPRSRVATLTGAADEQAERRVRELGSTLVLRKPLAPEAIVAIVRQMLLEFEQLIAGESDVAAVYEETAPLLRSIACHRYGIDGHDADDLIQETWLLFLERRATVRAQRAWLAGTIANLCRRAIQERYRMRDRAATIVFSEAENSPIEVQLSVQQALSQLDERSRALCEMIGIERFSYQEASERLALPLGSVGPMYLRARARLKHALSN